MRWSLARQWRISFCKQESREASGYLAATVSRLRPCVRGKLRAVAYVDVNAAGHLMKFAENVAANRGLPVTVFASVSEAETWLLGKASEAPKTE